MPVGLLLAIPQHPAVVGEMPHSPLVVARGERRVVQSAGVPLQRHDVSCPLDGIEELDVRLRLEPLVDNHRERLVRILLRTQLKRLYVLDVTRQQAVVVGHARADRVAEHDVDGRAEPARLDFAHLGQVHALRGGQDVRAVEYDIVAVKAELIEEGQNLRAPSTQLVIETAQAVGRQAGGAVHNGQITVAIVGRHALHR